MTLHLNSMGDALRVIVIGASGGIGQGFIHHLRHSSQVTEIYALSRKGTAPSCDKVTPMAFDFTDEGNIIAAAKALRASGKFDIIILATGWLHGEGVSPEKTLRALDKEAFLKSFTFNTIGPALTAKHFLSLLHRDRKTVFAALSARVGSISDNRLGGWYAYRAAKAALNMTLKTLSLEHGRRFEHAIIAGLHPGTVDTPLSEPFQNAVPEGKLFTPEFSAGKMLSVIDALTPDDSGGLYAWDGAPIAF